VRAIHITSAMPSPYLAESKWGRNLAFGQWNTVYPERTIVALRDQGQIISDDLFARLSSIGWKHINLTGDYIWNSEATEDSP
jgi:hypothetical protein